ncbi:MAG: AzlD domain-containing protein [Halomonadaceae bacterium]|nr:MAG: AzlD domain-containing protein [Halomonadaceae bacterium]
MAIETTPLGIVLIILVMGLVTLLTRLGGALLMAYVPLNRRVESFISAMASSVLIAIVVPMAFAGDLGARAALLATLVVMLITGRALPAIAAGLAAAAMVRQLF